MALHSEQRARWHWFTKAYLIPDPLSFERCEQSKSKMHIAHSQQATHWANCNFI